MLGINYTINFFEGSISVDQLFDQVISDFDFVIFHVVDPFPGVIRGCSGLDLNFNCKFRVLSFAQCAADVEQGESLK